MSEVNEETGVLRTFVLEDPEGSARALREWGGEGARIEVTAEGREPVLLVAADGRVATGEVRGEAITAVVKLATKSNHHVLRSLPAASFVRVRIAENEVWLNDAPHVALFSGKSTPVPNCAELVAIGALPDCLNASLEVLAVLHGSDVTHIDQVRRCPNLRHLDVTHADKLLAGC